ncbi:Chemotaxis protein CheV (CheW-REC domains) [Alkalihalophilus pseudofirmus OF4]|uniref:Chemotaxis protein CheV (CheW-REC domains) n=1 Tax=Alkalihalophilus pseudofirmus (strain ATCC BAA-2126 / JCM 17055 / OF4) TaxID=398511 RepID=D3G0N4_ALKPO|nr:chemotaxis protein [Alkalihalophilus pseudofirmus]ADC51196.1 Chemotaxis protein CheV (CheW-REC domains) [Alkalihalophilus pseudofirmus OF4]
MALNQEGILLDSGTNELEVIVFNVGNGTYGINVMKVREIVQAQTVTHIPNSHPHIEGMIRLRDEVLTVVNLKEVLGCVSEGDDSQDKFIVSELNKMKVAFRVSGVSRIHRISWEQIEKPTELSQGLQSATTGVIKLDGQMILLLDFEKIVVDINPSKGINVEQVRKLGRRERSHKKIVVAEDSAMLRKLLHQTLAEAGYEQVTFFENGKEALDYLEYLQTSDEHTVEEEVQLVITDLEMPKMDGLHLTRRIKEDDDFKRIPVIIFSSLITDDLYHKGITVGADRQVSKPEIVKLIEEIDLLI